MSESTKHTEMRARLADPLAALWQCSQSEFLARTDAVIEAASRAMLPVTDSQQPMLEARLTAMVTWLEANQPDVFRRGLWDAITGATPVEQSQGATPVAGWVSVEYTMGTNPTQTGVYACRIPHPIAPNLTEDKFLMWLDGRWAHLGSDQNYRGEVFGWIGPLPRKLPAAPVTPKQEQS